MENIPPLIKKILIGRGLKTQEEMSEFLYAGISSLSEPFSIPQMREACETLKNAVLNREKIFVYGDGDTDGICAVFLILKLLGSVSADFSFRLTHRLDEDYEIEEALIGDIKDEGYTLLISVDCGISSYAALEKAESFGIKCIVLDHHMGDRGKLPVSHVYVDPFLENDWPETTSNLSGAGIAFKFASGMALILPGIREEYFHSFIEAVCLSLLADFLPLTGENRILVKEGLRRMPFTGIKGLAHLIERQNLRAPFGTRDVTMKINPKLNSPGRMGRPEIALGLMMEDDPARIKELADEIEQNDRLRYRAVAKEMESIPHNGQDSGFVVSDTISPGICGIIASRLSGKYNKPYLVGAAVHDSLRGSIRAPKGCDLYGKLEPLGKYMLSMGGHSCAMGFKCSARHIEKIKEFWGSIHWQIEEPVNHYDCELDVSELTPELVKEINGALEPYGKGNPVPVFLCKGVTARNIARSKNQERSFWVSGKNDRLFESFLEEHAADIPAAGKKIDVLYTPCTRGNNGLYRLYLKILSYSYSS